MDSIIKEIFDGDDAPRDRQIHDPQYWRVNNHSCDLGIKLQKMLTQEQYAIFQEFVDARIEAASIEQTEYFIRGLRTGARLMIEILREPEEHAT